MLIGILWFFLMVCGIYMIATRSTHSDHSRVFFGAFALISSYALLQKMFFIFKEVDMQDYYYVLPLRELFFGQICRYVFTLYPLEVARPNWLKMRRMAIIVMPWVIYMAIYFICFGFQATPLRTFDDLLQNLDKPDVVMRIGMLLFMLPIEFVWALVYNPHRSSAGRLWLRKMMIMVTVIALAFVGNMLTRMVQWRILHVCVYLAYTLYVMYIELFVRIPVPKNRRNDIEEEQATIGKQEIPERQYTEEIAEVPDDELMQRVRRAMECDELWREPDFLLDDLVRHVGSNRTYVSQAIKRMGYSGFKDYINNMRVEYIRKQLIEPQHEMIQNLFFDAGYRSRASAWRNFTAIVGCSPSEFEERAEKCADKLIAHHH